VVLGAYLRILLLILLVILVGIGLVIVALMLLLGSIRLVISSIALLPQSCKIRIVLVTLIVGMKVISIAIKGCHGTPKPASTPSPLDFQQILGKSGRGPVSPVIYTVPSTA
jgi:hypothetical protein